MKKSIKKRSIKKRSIKKRRTKRSPLSKGGNSDNVNCCICNKKIKTADGLIPLECLTKYGANRAHKCCNQCWFSKFAIEGADHRCPGCVKGLPLNGPPLDTSLVIDLTEE